MAVPVSAGIGTGAAQVFEQDKTYGALKDASGTLLSVVDYKNKEAERKRKEAEEAKKQNLEDNFKMMKLTETDYTKVLDVDAPEIQKRAIDFQNKFRGRYEKVLTDPVVANEFNQEFNAFNSYVAERIQERDNYLKIEDEVTLSNPDKYTQEDRDVLLSQRKTPGSKFNMPQRKLKLPTLDQVKEKFDLDVFYSPGFKKVTDGGVTAYSGKLKGDDENKKAFFERINSEGEFGIEFMQGMSQAYPDLNTEELKDKAWTVFKSSYLPEKDTESINKTEQSTESGGGSDYKTTTEPFESKGMKGIVIGSSKTLPQIKFTYSEDGKTNIISGIPTEIWKDGEGNTYASVLSYKTSYTNESGDITYAGTGQSKTIKLTDLGSAKAAIRANYGIDIDSEYNKYYGGNTSNTAPKKGDVIDGYVFLGGDPADKKNYKKQ